MKVVDVRNFYSNLEQLSEEGCRFTLGYFALVLIATLLATGGLLANSIPVIIGSMCIAPFLGPSRAVCIGGLYRKWDTAGRGLVKQLVGLLAIGSPLAFLVTHSFLLLAPEITVTPTIIARTLPTIQSVYLSSFVALASGAAASLALISSPSIISDSRRELLDVMIGAEIAVSMIPPAAVVGIGFAFGRTDIALQSLTLLLINLACLDAVSSIPVLYFGGVQRKPLQIEKKIREVTTKIINATAKPEQVSIEIVLHSCEQADVSVQLQLLGYQSIPTQILTQRISEKIEGETGVANRVKVIIVPTTVHASYSTSTSP